MSDLETIASELYVLLPSEFTAARNERAKSAEGELAPAVKALSKPSPAAWATNLLAHAKADEVSQLFALGEALRDAQDGADRATLTKLGSQRRALVAALAKQAAALARDAGHPVNAAAVVDIQRTLNAGMSDAGAAAAVTSGRLVRALAGDGIDAVDLDDAVAGALPEGRSRARAVAKGLAKGPSKKELEAQRKARADADARLRHATEAAEAAEKAAAEAGLRRESLARERDELREQLADVDAQLGEASRSLDEAERDRKSAARERDRAERERDALDE